MDKLKGGIKLKVYSGTMCVLMIVAAVIFTHKILFGACGILGIIFSFAFIFFRDPERKSPEGENIIVSPADGKIVSISSEYEEKYLKEKALKISIYLNLFNVHINRIPITGTIEYIDYDKGKFYPAFSDKASEQNERLSIGIANEKCTLFLNLIAGAFTRRIIHNLQIGKQVNLGERFGMIKFGSRVELFLPEKVKLTVKMKEKVKGALSIIGKLNEK